MHLMTTWMDLEEHIIINEMSDRKDKYHMVSLIFESENKINEQNKRNGNRLTEDKQVAARESGVQGGPRQLRADEETQTSGYKMNGTTTGACSTQEHGQC